MVSPSPVSMALITTALPIMASPPVVSAFTSWVSATAQLAFILYTAFVAYKTIKPPPPSV